MNNSDMPIMPIFDKRGDTESYDQIGVKLNGLTKREHFAGLAIQGWLARCASAPHSAFINPEEVAETAVEFADALLRQLEQSNDKS